MEIKRFNQLNEELEIEDLYSIEFHGEGGERFQYIVALALAESPQEAQDKAGIKSTERGFYPARKMSTEEYDEILNKAKEEYEKLSNIL